MNKFRTRLIFIIGLTVASAAPCRCQIDGESQSYLDQATTSLYNLNYSDCQDSLRKLISADPQNPFGYLLEAGAIWWQSSNEYDLFKETPTLEGVFEQDVRHALKKAGPLAQSSDEKNKANGLFVQGMALGLRGQWLLLRGHWFEAYLAGRGGLKRLRQCLKVDPNYYDADLGLGAYQYQAAKFGRKIKLGFVFRVFGNEKNGIKLISLAKDKGRFASRQAAIFLLTLYLQDKHDYEKALSIAAHLGKSFPASPYFKFLKAMIYFNLGQKGHSYDLGRYLFGEFQKNPGAFEPKVMSLACSFSGNPCLNRGQARGFIRWIDGALAQAPASDAEWISTLHLLRGYALNILGDSTQARSDYYDVLAGPDIFDWRMRARTCLADGCNRDSILSDLRAWAN
ncbi:MAG: tetratricopeptide repeat protein [Elusimicrobiota bacterium]